MASETIKAPVQFFEPSTSDVECYGCTVEAMNKGFDQALRLFDNTTMLVTSILSDVQELMNLGHVEEARQYIKRVKYLVNHRVISNGNALAPERVVG